MPDPINSYNNISSALNNRNIEGWYGAAKELMGNRKSVSFNEAKSIFAKENLDLNEARLGQIAMGDGNQQVSVKEIAAMLFMMDGRKEAIPGEMDGQTHFATNFDGYVEDRSEEGGNLGDTLQYNATSEEYKQIMEAFDKYDKSQNNTGNLERKISNWLDGHQDNIK